MEPGELPPPISSTKVQCMSWFSVNYRLPGEYVCVIAYDKEKDCVMEDYIHDGGRWTFGEDVTHWMPMPKPPSNEDL